MRGQVHAAAAEADALMLQAQPLLPAGFAGQGDAPAGGNDAVPGQSAAGPQRPGHLPGGSGPAGPGGDLAVRGDAAGGNAANEGLHASE